MSLTPHYRTLLFTVIAMLAFAGNSLLCRAALSQTDIDPASFTAVRIVSGALALWLIMRLRTSGQPLGGNWRSAAALCIYATAFSIAYLHLDTGVGALLLFGAVQISMVGWGIWRGERPGRWQILGLLLAMLGLIAFLLPGGDAPSVSGAALMVLAGVAWGAYSLLGRGVADPVAATTGNFLRATPLALAVLLVFVQSASLDAAGFGLAVLSGALASGVGYAIWYQALRGLSALQGAGVQLSVPVLAALAAAVLLQENLTLRLLVASCLVLGGIVMILAERAAAR
ncbi:MAG TPA: DMT family transporter [Pseudomonas xinjiangensis]|uniref:DMT family transporter n=2 Tax=root TaxID=1 RepID=A0A7V1BR16_9GAMM|nr:DMT family transporter [Halopseudomonas xinjiangensis]HEC47883.1 DMT family transporter [Halopseudomonas xinjiangensis]